MPRADCVGARGLNAAVAMIDLDVNKAIFRFPQGIAVRDDT